MIDWFQIARDAGSGVYGKTELTELTHAQDEGAEERHNRREVDSVNSVNSHTVTPERPPPAFRLAEEYDDAQERGEVQKHGGQLPRDVAAPNIPTAADLGLRRDEIHEARRLRDAEQGSHLSEGKVSALPLCTKATSSAVGAFPYGTSPGGRPLTWTGRVVSLDAWRSLTEWERHGPRGAMWNGLTECWEGARK